MSAGQKLRAAREAKKMSLDEACLRTKIQRRTIEALEEDRLLDILDPAYSKIFLKKYAIFLGLDPSTLSGEYSDAAVSPGPTQRQESPGTVSAEPAIIRSSDFKSTGVVKRWAAPAAAMLAAVIGIGFLGYLVTDLLHNLNRKDNAIVESSGRNPKTSSEKQPMIPASKPLKLTIQTTADVWMQVKADGTVVFQNVLAQNSKENWTAKKEFELWTGNAGATQAILNGKPLESLGRGVKKGIRITHSGIES